LKRILTVLMLGAVCASAFSFDETADFKKFLDSVIPKLVKAFKTADVKFFETISTADFTETEMGQTVNKKQAMDQMKAMNKMGKVTECSFKVLSAKAANGKGTATTEGHSTMVVKPTKKGDKSHTMKVDMWYVENWVKAGNGWKIKSLTMDPKHPMKMTMDGKPMDPSKMGGGGD
jgi:hypothetical protein